MHDDHQTLAVRARLVEGARRMTRQQACCAIIVTHQDVLVSERFNRFILLVVPNSEGVAGRHRFPHYLRISCGTDALAVREREPWREPGREA